MKQTNQNKRIGIYLLIILIASFLVTQTPVGGLLLSSPWWVYLVFVGIVLSGYFATKYSLEDKRFESEWIEKEGDIYMERIEQEKRRRKKERS